MLAACAAALLLIGAACPPADQAAPPQTQRVVALTFDDIPAGQVQPGAGCDRGQLRAINESLTVALLEEGAPSAALVTTGNVCARLRDTVLGEVIALWEQSGAVIGNHGHGHLDLSRVPLATYTADLARADSQIARARGGKGRVRFFRHPFLHAGGDSATAGGLARWLVERGYTVAPVTIDNNEWVYAAAYSRAITRGDSAMMRRLVPAYLEHMEQAFAFAESMSVRVVGTEFPQVLLLHANELNRDYIREVIRLAQGRGYRFISLEEALAHPAYRRASHYVGPWGISWILRWSPDSSVWRMDLPAVEEWVSD